MGTIDRYVLRLYIKVLVICFVSLTGLFIIIDAFNNLDELLSLGEKQGGLMAVLTQYYGARALAFFDRTSSLMALVAATFAVTSLQRSNELAALMAAGIPKIRVISPLLGAAVFVAVLAAANRELVIPRFRDGLTRDVQDMQAGAKDELTPRYDNLTDILLAGKYAVRSERRILEPTFRLPPGMGGFGSQLMARCACYHDPQGDRPGGYQLEGVSQPSDLAKIDSFAIEGHSVILSPSDTTWLQRDEC
ncbi:MAG: LptF/LptG family permease, partial [Planctomycetes bacterium]|nr:LptF/LptG family permease [Planctomycetota bacterium]